MVQTSLRKVIKFYLCPQTAQQHGRRLPAVSSLTVRFTWLARVSGFLFEMTQQIHSLRASGVMSSQAATALGLALRAARKSLGIL
jgi:hypothetical protein